MSGSGDVAGLNHPPEPVDGKVGVRVAADGMEAVIIVAPPRNGGRPAIATEAMISLSRAGVAFGIDSAAIERLILEGATSEQGSEGVVARGTPPVRGRNAVDKLHERLQTPTGYPQPKEDGTVDHFQLNLIRNVAKGAELIRRQPATKGVPGTNVFGSTVPCIDGKEIPLRPGKGCRLSEDGLTVTAEIEGHAVMTYDGKLSVSPIFEVRGDVDTSTGNIDFVGTVVVRGSVGHGFAVRAGQNVEVHGGIDGGSVEGGGDVTVRYGILGGSRGRVVAGGKIQCRFIENGDVRCHRDLIVTDSILHSKVRCGGKVSVQGRRGSIIGGLIKAKEEVSSRILGSSLLATTEIEVGISPESRDELEAVRRSLQEAAEGLRKAQQAVALLREMEAKVKFDQGKRELLAKSIRSQYHFQGQVEALAARKANLEQELSAAEHGRVRAFDTAYPGVRIGIGTESYLVVDALQHVSFYLSGHHVTLGSAS